MSDGRSPPRTCRGRPSSTSASPPWPRSSATPSPPPASTTWSPAPGSWAGRASAVRVIDGDLGISGSVTGQRDGFDELAAEVALGQVGIILALEVSRLARNNAAWYRLLDLAGMLRHPRRRRRRRLPSGAVQRPAGAGHEGHHVRSRAPRAAGPAGRRHQEQGRPRRAAPRPARRPGLGRGRRQIRFHPDEAVTGVIAAVFERFAVCGSVRATWLWLREQGLRWPLQQGAYRRGTARRSPGSSRPTTPCTPR